MQQIHICVKVVVFVELFLIKLELKNYKMNVIKKGIVTSEAIITKGYNLKAKYIIHAVGPIYRDGKHGEREVLEAAYRNSLLLAKQYKLRSIAFPLISSGIYGYPYNEALEVAKETINTF